MQTATTSRRRRRPLQRTLRFAVMCSGTSFPAWQARCIRALIDSGHAEPALLIVNETPPQATTGWRKLLRRIARRDLLWAAFLRLFVVGKARASRREDLSAELAGVPVIGCRVRREGKFSEYFSDEDVEVIRAGKLDFVMRFEFGIIRGAILEAARYGVWSFHHDDEERYRGGPPCFWEIYRGDPVTGSVLQRLTERLDGGVILHKGWFRTIDHSYARNRDQAYLGSADWPARVCAQIRAGAGGFVDDEPTKSTAPIYRNPRARHTIWFALTLFGNFVYNQFAGLFRADQWTVGIVDAPVARFLEDGKAPDVQWLPEPGPTRYLADPFGAWHGDRLAILAEDYDYSERRGHITVLAGAGPSSFTGRLAEVHRGPETVVHASYPFVFENRGEVLCVPETFEAREVALYHAAEFPHRWERVATLLRGRAALDPTVVRFGGRWWLFATDRDAGGNAKLYAWHATSLSGRWIPHAANPVKTDVRSARPGGTPFVHDGVLYRPAQDNAGTYGGAIVINRVNRLTPTEFEEEVVRTVRPFGKPYTKGMHTLSSAGDLTLIDGKRSRFIWPAFKTELKARLRRGRYRP